ncbi:hypothetical protein [Streptomyces sp. NPDC051546]|uniref:hypothetical protein n=1 Tax=Streptomyces sp. NPDC051546 TaxID=3365655 RepID=UPI0037999A9D
MPNPSKYVLHVRNYRPQATPLHREPATWETWQKPAVDVTTGPTRITVFASTPNGAIAKADSHLALLHARRAWNQPDSLPPTAADVIYAAARRRYSALTARERETERTHEARHERGRLQASALHDVMRELGELA